MESLCTGLLFFGLSIARNQTAATGRDLVPQIKEKCFYKHFYSRKKYLLKVPRKALTQFQMLILWNKRLFSLNPISDHLWLFTEVWAFLWWCNYFPFFFLFFSVLQQQTVINCENWCGGGKNLLVFLSKLSGRFVKWVTSQVAKMWFLPLKSYSSFEIHILWNSGFLKIIKASWMYEGMIIWKESESGNRVNTLRSSGYELSYIWTERSSDQFAHFGIIRNALSQHSIHIFHSNCHCQRNTLGPKLLKQSCSLSKVCPLLSYFLHSNENTDYK